MLGLSVALVKVRVPKFLVLNVRLSVRLCYFGYFTELIRIRKNLREDVIFVKKG